MSKAYLSIHLQHFAPHVSHCFPHTSGVVTLFAALCNSYETLLEVVEDTPALHHHHHRRGNVGHHLRYTSKVAPLYSRPGCGVSSNIHPGCGVSSNTYRGCGVSSNIHRGCGVPSNTHRGCGVSSNTHCGCGVSSNTHRGCGVVYIRPQVGSTGCTRNKGTKLQGESSSHEITFVKRKRKRET